MALSKGADLRQSIVALQECATNLKEEYDRSKSPITDDSLALQRFCARFEFLLKYEQKDRSGFIGGKKDYWNYFTTCLQSNKRARDGIKFVRSHNEWKTSLGKGRAFVRFALVYQRLADMMQQCIMSGKLTSEWYTAKSIWMNYDLSSAAVNVLYDLNEVQFDLGVKGYDLDNGWPTFAHKDGSIVNRWNTSMSRTSSVNSLNSTLMDVSMAQSEDGHTGVHDDLEEEENRATSEIDPNGGCVTVEEDASSQTLQEQAQLATQVTNLQAEQSLLLGNQNRNEALWLKQKNELLSKLSTAEIHLRNSESHTTSLQSSLDKANGRLETERERVLRLESENGRLSGKLEQLNGTLNQLQSESINRTPDTAQQSTNKSSALEEKVELLSSERDKLLSEQEKLSVALAASEKVVASLSEAVRAKDELIGERSRAIERLEVDAAEKERVFGEKVSGFSEQLSAAEEAAVSLREEARSLASALNESGRESEERQRVAQELQHSLTLVEAQKKELRRDLSSEKGQKVSLAQELSSERDKAALAEKEIVLAQQMNANLEQELSKMQEKNNDLRAELARAEGGGADVQSSLTQKLSEIEGLEKAGRDAAREVELLRRDLDRVNSNCAETKTALEAARMETQKVRTQLEESLRESESLQQRLTEKEKLAAQCKKDWEGASMDLDLTRTLLKEAQMVGEERLARVTQIERMKNECEKARDASLVELRNVSEKLSEKDKAAGELERRVNELAQNQDKLVKLGILKAEEWSKLRENLEQGLEQKSALLKERDECIMRLERESKDYREELSSIQSEMKASKEVCAMQIDELEKSGELVKKELHQTRQHLVESQSAEKGLQETLLAERGKLSMVEATLALEQAEKAKTAEDNGRELKLMEEEWKRKAAHALEEKERVKHMGREESVRKSAQEQEVWENKLGETTELYKSKLSDLKEELESSVIAVREQSEREVKEVTEKGEKALKEMEEANIVEIRALSESLEQERKTAAEAKEVAELSRTESSEVLIKVTSEKRELEQKVNTMGSERDELMTVLEKLTVAKEVQEEQLEESGRTLKAQQEELAIVTKQVEASKSELKTLKKEQAEKSVTLTDLQGRLESTKAEWRREQGLLEQHTSTLQLDLSTLQLAYEGAFRDNSRLNDDVARMRDAMEQQDKVIVRMTSDLGEMTQSRHVDQTQVEDLLDQLTTVLGQRDESDSHFNAAVAQMETELTNAKAIISSKERQCDRLGEEVIERELKAAKPLQEQNATLQEENSSLRGHLVKLLGDKARLWKKADRLDTLSRAKSEARWMDNSVVTHCSTCNQQFSLLLRKHHCRLCGGIFCWTCSNNWVTMASSPSKSRVCRGCLNLLEEENNPSTSSSSSSRDSSSPEKSQGPENPQNPENAVSPSGSNSASPHPGSPSPEAANSPIPPGEARSSSPPFVLSSATDSHTLLDDHRPSQKVQTLVLAQSSSLQPSSGGPSSGGPSSGGPSSGGPSSGGPSSGGPSSGGPSSGGPSSGGLSSGGPEDDVCMEPTCDGAEFVPTRLVVSGLAEEKRGLHAEVASRECLPQQECLPQPCQSEYEEIDRETTVTSDSSKSLPGNKRLDRDDTATEADVDVSTSENNHAGMVEKVPSAVGANAASAAPSGLKEATDNSGSGSLKGKAGRPKSRLSARPMTQRVLEGGDTYTVPVAVSVSMTKVSWAFSSAVEGLAFELSHMEKGSNTEEILVPQRTCPSEKKVVTGKLTAHKEGDYLLKFYNLSRHAVTLKYNVKSEQPADS